MITINFYCHNDSAIIPASGVLTNPYQKVEANPGDQTSLFFFVDPLNYATNLINCDVQSVYVTVATGTVGALHPNLHQKDASDRVYLINDNSTERLEYFNLTVNDVNATYQVGPFTLDIGCT